MPRTKKQTPAYVLEKVSNGERMVWDAMLTGSGHCFDPGEHCRMFDTKAEALQALRELMPCECAECKATA